MFPDPRRRRQIYNESGHAHALTFSCYRRYRFLQTDRACTWLADSIEQSRQKHEIDLWGYVFMPDHVHLVIHPRRAGYDISAILKSIKNPVGRRGASYLRKTNPQWLKRVAVVRGSRTEYRFWEAGGGYDRNLIEPSTLMNTLDYIHLNPVRKNLVARSTDWIWSSAGWFEGHEINRLRPDPIPPEWLES